jgi:dTMP kinase
VPTRLLSFPDYTTPLGLELKGFLVGQREYSPQVRHMLFAANRWERREDIQNWLANGDVLIVNRYTESNLAYGMANGLSLDWLLHLEEGLPKANLVVLLDVRPSRAKQRRAGRNDRYENDLLLQERVAENYRQLAEKFSWSVVRGWGEVAQVNEGVVKVVTGSLPDLADQTI